MNVAFVDTQYFIAIFQPSDQWHEKAVAVEALLNNYEFVTTDAVLTEVLNYFGEYGEQTRLETVALVRDVFSAPRFDVVETNRAEFLRGVNLYENRLDKGYSLTDCISINICRERGIGEVLTHDHHFTQEGLTILL